jgi:hypothetical protein
MIPHELLCKVLGRLKPGTGLAWPKDCEPLCSKPIDNASRKRGLGADNSQTDLLLFYEVVVPPLPGATKIFSTRGDFARHQAIACSRPPLPMTKTFI